MFNSGFRRIVVAVAILGLLAFTPAAQARPLGLGQASVEAGRSWLDAALSWWQGLLQGDGERLPRRRSTPPAKPSGIDLTYSANTGSCIDPQGNTRPGCES